MTPVVLCADPKLKLKLKRTDWRSLQRTEAEASESIQLEFAFLSMRSVVLVWKV